MSDTEAMINVMPPVPPPDPDAEATVLDFMDCTEHLPNDITRSLRLIGSLDHDYHRCTAQLNTLAIQYGDLRKKGASAELAQTNGDGINQPNEYDLKALTLRVKMARQLNSAIRAREEASAEAARLYENVDRHFNKLSATLNKLQQIPLPDREPTPKPAPLPVDGETQPRITLRVADRYGQGQRTPLGAGAGRRRRAILPGSTRRRIFSGNGREEDWEDLPDSADKSKRRGRRPGVGFQPKPLPPPPTTETGEPMDPKDMPWNRLLPHELARLRKRMKKNTQWTPSTTMILRELESLGRGIANKDKYMHQIESGNYPHYGPEDGGIGSLATESSLFTTENRGMKLNAAKRRLKEAQALAAVKLAAQEAADKDAKMEDSVVVGSHRPTYGGKGVSSQVSSATLVQSSGKAEVSPAPAKSRENATRGKGPEAMNSLMMRSSINLQQQKPAPKEQSPPSAATVRPPTPRLQEASPQPAPQEPTPVPPSSPPPASSQQEMSHALSGAETSRPPTPPPPSSVPPPESPAAQRTSEKPSAASPPASIAGHKRKRSLASSPTGPSSPTTEDAKSSVSTVSPAAATAQAPPSSRKRGSVSRASAASAPSAKIPPSPPTKQTTPTAPTAGEVKPEGRRRGRPPGTFKVNAAFRRKNAANKNIPLPKVEEKVPKQEPKEKDQPARMSPAGKKSESDEWEEEDMAVNEHEPRYCLCNGVSHGTMLGCDNEECELEWFHLECLGLSAPPPRREKWFCPRCKEKEASGGSTRVGGGDGEGKDGVKRERKRRRRFK